jgi:hypothetical protein
VLQESIADALTIAQVAEEMKAWERGRPQGSNGVSGAVDRIRFEGDTIVIFVDGSYNRLAGPPSP